MPNQTKLIVWIVAGILFLNIYSFVMYKVTVAGATKSILQRMEQYSPSQYGPGLDPDKVNPEALQQKQTKVMQSDPNYRTQTVDFNTAWELSRASPSQ
jgi:hypothetical protein